MAKPNENKHAKTVVLLGFDKLGFQVPTSRVEFPALPDCNFETVTYEDVSRIDSADGIIVPQGIFEKIDGSYIYCDVARLDERYHQVINLMHKGSWVVFLVQKIRADLEVARHNIHPHSTDLCKKVMGIFRIDSSYRDSGLVSYSRRDEFREFIEKYGTARTIFSLWNSRETKKISTASNDAVTGIVCGGQIFFLPFHTTSRDKKIVLDIAEILTKSVTEYLAKNSLVLPEWLHAFRFNKEDVLRTSIDNLIKDLELQESQLTECGKFKGILSNSGDSLRGLVADILKSYFGFQVDDEEKFQSDMILLDQDKNRLVVVETKGTKKGIATSDVSQVDVNRDRDGLEQNIPGLLLMNVSMDNEDLNIRFKDRVDKLPIQRGVQLNVIIMRTLDFLVLMKKWEDLQPPKRQSEFLELLSQGGGWVEAKQDGTIAKHTK